EMVFLSEIVFLLKTFFFVYIGLSIRFTDLRWLIFGGVITALLFLPRLIAVRLALRVPTPNRDAALAACMLPKGLAAAVLAALLVEQQVPMALALQSTVYAVIFFGVVFTSVLVFAVEQRLGGAGMIWLLGRTPELAVGTVAVSPE
ncbi:MAG TPA: cation:proton antiporter, partial [Terriglobales bacterium]|nr:cation:proton antiporter [Terriglobales bacterium]